ncbi:hypothetical protein E6H20_03765 [Candidatus Bathyarchaeota archaeon]|nr:MAG: hypothetical protein E6H20_03765 [Candidatus Bathyarchaeota archaeon]
MPDKIDADLSPAKFRVVSRETTETVLAFFLDIKAVRVFPGRRPSEIQDLLSEPPAREAARPRQDNQRR